MAERLALVSIDKTADGVAIKLGENARISPEKLLAFLEETDGASFSPSGILRVVSTGDDPIRLARSILEIVQQ